MRNRTDIPRDVGFLQKYWIVFQNLVTGSTSPVCGSREVASYQRVGKKE